MFAGIGLMEIVTEPDFENGIDCSSFVREVQLMMRQMNVCLGSFRGQFHFQKIQKTYLYLYVCYIGQCVVVILSRVFLLHCPLCGTLSEGALRVDANISVHRPGEPLGTRSEVKNLGSLKALKNAVGQCKSQMTKNIKFIGNISWKRNCHFLMCV
jgi:Asp-tRNA(Asn)/Glu-tRNA(Gln) amidotransferase B subunit